MLQIIFVTAYTAEQTSLVQLIHFSYNCKSLFPERGQTCYGSGLQLQYIFLFSNSDSYLVILFTTFVRINKASEVYLYKYYFITFFSFMDQTIKRLH